MEGSMPTRTTTERGMVGPSGQQGGSAPISPAHHWHSPVIPSISFLPKQPNLTSPYENIVILTVTYFHRCTIGRSSGLSEHGRQPDHLWEPKHHRVGRLGGQRRHDWRVDVFGHGHVHAGRYHAERDL